MFYARKQQIGEPVTTYINEMMKLGAKLHINITDAVATIKRGLLDHIKRQVIMHRGIEQPHELLQQATLAESYFSQASQSLPAQHTQVCFDVETDNISAAQPANEVEHINNLYQATSDIKSMIGNLTQRIDRISLDAQQLRSRSPTLYRQHTQDEHYNVPDVYSVGSTHEEQLCSNCTSRGHAYENCRLHGIDIQHTYTPQYQQTRGRPTQRQFYAPRQYTQPQASHYSAYERSRSVQPQHTNQYYNQRYQHYDRSSTQVRNSQNFD